MWAKGASINEVIWDRFYDRVVDGWDPAVAKDAQAVDRLFGHPVPPEDLPYFAWKIEQRLGELANGPHADESGDQAPHEEAKSLHDCLQVISSGVTAYQTAAIQGRDSVVSGQLEKALRQQFEANGQNGMPRLRAMEIYQVGRHLGRLVWPEVLPNELRWLQNELTLTRADRDQVASRVAALTQTAIAPSPPDAAKSNWTVWLSDPVGAVRNALHKETGPAQDDQIVESHISFQAGSRLESTLSMLTARVNSLETREHWASLALEAFRDLARAHSQTRANNELHR